MLTTLTVLWSHLFRSALMSLKERIKVFWPFSELLLKSDRRQSRWNSRSRRVLPWITPGPGIGGTSSDLQLQTLRCFSFCVFLRSTLFFVYFPVLEFGNNFDVTSNVWFPIVWDLEMSSPVSSTPISLQIFTTMQSVFKRLPVCCRSEGT